MKVLFVSHDAGRTGAPTVLLTLVRWLRARGAVQPTFLLRRSGELAGEFTRLGPVIDLQQMGFGATASPFADALGTFASLGQRLSLRLLRERLRRSAFDLAYVNTATNGSVHDLLLQAGLPVLTHVHEMGYWLDHGIEPEALRKCLAQSHSFIACSGAVREALAARGVARDRIEVVHSFIDLAALDQPPGGSARPSLRQRLGLPEESFVVGAAGALGWDKGADLFVQVARSALARSAARDLHFVWIGCEQTERSLNLVRHDARLAGIGDQLHFPGSQADGPRLLGELDLLVLPSRHDSFPLVVLEAAARGVCTVAFAGAGGTEEFVADGCGVAVPYLDIEAMAGAVVELLDAAERRRAIGEKARARARAAFGVEPAAPRILELMQEAIGSGARRLAWPIPAVGLAPR